MVLSLPTVPLKKRGKSDKLLELSTLNRQTNLYNIDDADLELMIRASGQSPSYVIHELIHEIMQ